MMSFGADSFAATDKTTSTIVPGPFRLGSEAHKQAFCRMLLDTHDPYRPAVMPWPELDEAALSRLTGLPIWNIAVQVEGRAARAVQSYAEMIKDPLLREAVVMDGQ